MNGRVSKAIRKLASKRMTEDDPKTYNAGKGAMYRNETFTAILREIKRKFYRGEFRIIKGRVVTCMS